VWLDAATFLEVRYDREVRGPAGRDGIVFVYYRDYRAIDGLQVPMTIETRSANGRPGDRMLIDRVLMNPPLEDSAFSRPGGLGGRAQGFGRADGMPGRSVPPALGRTARPGSSAVPGATQPGSAAEAPGAPAGAAAPSGESAPAPATSDAPPAAGTPTK
jgi:hypothetical protein